MAALDYDGTLSHIAQAGRCHPRRCPGSRRLLAERVGSVVLISGRPSGQLLEFSGLRDATRPPRLTVLAQYGLQRWDGTAVR